MRSSAFGRRFGVTVRFTVVGVTNRKAVVIGDFRRLEGSLLVEQSKYEQSNSSHRRTINK